MSDLDEPKEGEENPFQEDAAVPEAEKKKPRANIISLKPDDLCTNPLGLTYLY